MSKKYDAFIAELRALCDKHDVCMETGNHDGTMSILNRGKHGEGLDDTAFWQGMEFEDGTERDQ